MAKKGRQYTYMICSSNGSTYDGDGNNTENLQVIDWISATSEKNALEKIANENPYILHGYENFIIFKLVKGYRPKYQDYFIKKGGS